MLQKLDLGRVGLGWLAFEQEQQGSLLDSRILFVSATKVKKMRIQCDVCERNLASVMCCADEAALCGECDTRIHAANKLANKHVRVSLLAVPESPNCDICQVGWLGFGLG